MNAPAFHYLELPDSAGHVGIVAIELPGGSWANPTRASDQEWLQAARLSTRRLGRCRRGSDAWLRHRAIIAEAERRFPTLHLRRVVA